MIISCPTCGADVEFRYDDSFVRVCGACRSAVLRSDRGIETLGRMADLVPIESPLRLFSEGRYGSTTFLLIGMAQLRHGAGGIWQEWYAKLGGGQWAWVSEAQGRYYLTFERPGVAVLPYNLLSPGLRVTLGDRAYTVDEIGQGTYASASGEIPYRLDPRGTFWFADLSDGQGGFATIDYNDGTEEPSVYIGHQVSLADLGMSGGEAPVAAPARPQGAKLACPNCGGSLELKAPDQTLRVACPYCNHLVSVQTGNLSVIRRLAKKAKPQIPLGTKGVFSEGELTVIGYMQRSALIDGSWYSFDEYLLYAPPVGFRWLVCSDGHWSYVQPVAPGAVEVMPVRYDGVPFELFARADLRVDEVLGEFYWLVQEGERVVAEDYIAPPAMLSCETSKTEQSWSLSTYLWPRELRAAFRGVTLQLPPPVGVGANQPYGLQGVGKVAAAVFGMLCAIGFAKCSMADNAVKHRTTVLMPSGRFEPPVTPPGTPAAGTAEAEAGSVPASTGSAEAAPPENPANIAFTEKFRLTGGDNIEIELSAPLSNSWAYVAVDLVNDQSGAFVSFDKSLEYYSGYDGGESWSEGDRLGSVVLRPMAAGDYVMRLDTVHGSPSPVPLAITVRQDVFRYRYWLYALLALGIPFGLVGWHAYAFKKKRWENSQLSRSPESSGSGFSVLELLDDD